MPAEEVRHREETLPLVVEWDVFVVEFVPPGQTEWRAFSHGEHDTLEQAEGWIEAQGFDPLLPLRICHYVGSSTETRQVIR
ncbi:MAG: hypothetical protein EKK55_11800 [Rhodocyclaceae bacterium]|nr:MAG: hypothetical protein EKK55_11800 [Rhodocyclaceae bacterium]